MLPVIGIYFMENRREREKHTTDKTDNTEVADSSRVAAETLNALDLGLAKVTQLIHMTMRERTAPHEWLKCALLTAYREETDLSTNYTSLHSYSKLN